MRCPSCGATVESTSQRFCQTCGAPLDPQQLRQQAAQTEGGPASQIVNPQLAQTARTSIDNLGNQVNQAIATRNTGQLLVYAGTAVVAVILISLILKAVLAALPFVIIIAIIAYMRRNRGYRRW